MMRLVDITELSIVCDAACLYLQHKQSRRIDENLLQLCVSCHVVMVHKGAGAALLSQRSAHLPCLDV